MKPLSEDKKNGIICLCDKGLSLRQIAEKCGFCHIIVARIRKKYVSAPISSQNGRPQLISDRAAREIAHCIRLDSYKAPKIAAQEIEISASEWTIRRSLKRIGLRAKEKESGIKQTMKFGGGSIMCWGCFTHRGVGPLVRIEGIMRKEHYLTILQSNLPFVVNSIGYNEREVVFQQDGDPKHPKIT
uniref:uncharacterized protein LOC117159882 n=1 Tax=Bombus vancouverensis nearcticus TaxID=2705178 RepID=UPI00143B84E4|nr:uncharacterized protein LOC117159882 [Bombus vancouverensis nearcticus]